MSGPHEQLPPASRAGMLRLIHVTDRAAWARRHGVEPFTHPCGTCGRLFVVEVPFAKGKLRGLTADPCPCGNTDTPYCVPWSSFGDD